MPFCSCGSWFPVPNLHLHSNMNATYNTINSGHPWCIVPLLDLNSNMNGTSNAQTVTMTTAGWTLDWLNTSIIPLERFMTIPSFVLTVIFTFILIIWITRIYSGLYLTSNRSGRDGVKTVGMLPYWIPFFGHIFAFSKDPDKLVQRVRYVLYHLLKRNMHHLTCSI